LIEVHVAIQRKNALNLIAAEQKAYIDGVTAMISDGTYLALVAHHKDMSHNMHNMGTVVSQLRFLPWHRAYLLHMEAELIKHEPKAFIPYWKWVDGGVPDWLKVFKPTVGGIKNERNDLGSPITDQARIDFLMKIKDYPTFTGELEVDPHNQGHGKLGKPMQNVPTAPSDPIFWMHHGEVDRVWSEWQAKNPGKGPILTGKDATMDPWSDTVTSLDSIASLGYSYA
jgi:tyrosinase